MRVEPITLGAYVLTLDLESGALVGLRLGDGPEVMGPGLGIDLPDLRLKDAPFKGHAVYTSHQIEGNTLRITLQVDPLIVVDSYRAVRGLLERRVTIQNPAEDEIQLLGVRIGLAGVSIDAPADCRFDAPGNTLRPHARLNDAASQEIRPVARGGGWDRPRYDIRFAPGKDQVWGEAFGAAPDKGPGLLVVHNPRLEWNLLTWYVSGVEAAQPWVSGDGIRATLGYDIELAGWLSSGESLEGGTQYILIHQGSYESALGAYQSYYTHTGILPPLYGDLLRAADWSAVYEVHPGQFGGFRGFQDYLPRLAEMGIETLYLLPVQAHRNKTGLPWDENWEGSGSPYAIHDFDRLEPSLGTEEDFKALVAEAHRLGMKVLMDFVPQGSSLEARYVEEHPEWYCRDEAGNLVHSHGWDDTWSFDWANPDYQAYMRGWATRFVRDFGVDGFRIDAPHGKEPNWDRAIPYHASATNLGARGMLQDLRRDLLADHPEAVLYCELFGPLWVQSHDISNDYHPYAMVLSLFERRLTPTEFNEYLRDYWAVMPQTGEGIPTPRICFIETHDTRTWPAYALRGSVIGQALLGILVMGGFTPMIWSGQERGQEDFLGGLFRARRQSEALRRGVAFYNALRISDDNHYRRKGGDSPAGSIFTLLRQAGDETLFCLASLFPEQVSFRLTLPLETLGLDPARRYRLHDLISGEDWAEAGQTEWSGSDLESLRLTPRMYCPYIFRITPVG